MKTRTQEPDLEYYMGKLQPEYQSAGQAQIGRMLDNYQIPFFYREPHLVWENGQRTIRRPDFTLPTYDNAVIEYTRRDGHAIDRKKELYRQNQITALFLHESDLAAPNWQRRLYDRLEETHRNPEILSADKYRPS